MGTLVRLHEKKPIADVLEGLAEGVRTGVVKHLALIWVDAEGNPQVALEHYTVSHAFSAGVADLFFRDYHSRYDTVIESTTPDDDDSA